MAGKPTKKFISEEIQKIIASTKDQEAYKKFMGKVESIQKKYASHKKA